MLRKLLRRPTRSHASFQARRYHESIKPGRPSRSNVSFILGASIGTALGLASALYITHYILPDPRSRKFGSRRDYDLAVQELLNFFGNRASIDEQDLITHGSSSWFPMHNQGIPNIVVYPETTAEVQRIATIASKARVPVISYGAGSAIEGQFSPPFGGICIDFSHMDTIYSIDQDNMTVTLGPGVSWQTLNSVLDEQKTGLFFPVDPGPGATIGGCIGTSCSGPNAARYGTMKDWVLTMTVVTIDGQVFRTRSMAKKSSTGYDLNRLMIGAEGTLGLVTEITLKLTNKPEHELVGTCAFEDVEDVTRLVINAKKCGLNAQCLELLDGMNMPAINSYADGDFAPFPEKPHLFFKLSGPKETIVQESRVLASLCKAGSGTNFQLAKSDHEAMQIWSARKNLLLASLAANVDCVAISTDVCVPISKLPDLVKQYRHMSKDKGLISSIIGHIADGNFHSLILHDDRDADQVRRAYELSDELCQLSLRLGGTVSGEHGVGSTKRKYLETEYGEVGVDMMRRIKNAWDPYGLLNPGKLLPDVA